MSPLPHTRGSIFTRIAGVIFLCVIAAVCIIHSSPTLSTGVTSLTAKFFVAHCAGQSDKPACYERSVPQLLYVTPIEDVFAVVREIQKQDTSYRFCHVLGHQLGVFEEQRDPSHWIDLMHKNPPDGMCSNGYVHGVIVQRFNKEIFSPAEIDAIVPDLSRACEESRDWHPTGLDTGMCYHGIGHVLTHITGADMPRAVSYCRQISIHGREDYSQVCISGVFMQIFQPLELEDYQLIATMPVKPTKENLASFCGVYATEEERSACFGEGWPLFREELQTAQGIEKFCTTSRVASTQKDCFTTVLSIGARGALSDPKPQEARCAALPEGIGKECFNILAEAFIEEDRTQVEHASAVCSRAPKIYQNSCFQYLLARADFTFGPDKNAREALCKVLPVSWSGRCEAGERPEIQ